VVDHDHECAALVAVVAADDAVDTPHVLGAQVLGHRFAQPVMGSSRAQVVAWRENSEFFKNKIELSFAG
jgi:hypothetical protein